VFFLGKPGLPGQYRKQRGDTPHKPVKWYDSP